MRIHSSQALVPLLVLSLASACVDEKIVFEDPGDDPGEIPTEAAGFVGYQDREARLTFCGTCHTGTQSEWLATAHAKAWAGVDSAAAQAAKLRRSTNQLGNAAVNPSGWAVTPIARYEDVQCEACHGPGLVHIGSPSNANEPRAPLAVGTLLNTGCGECHSGPSGPFLEEWGQSAHQAMGAMAGTAGCTACHSGDGALVAWGVNSDWAERGSTTGRLATTCAVCHDPHGGEGAAQLRFPITTASLTANLCMKCHDRRAVPDPTTLLGPHASAARTLLGTSGWWPEGRSRTVVATHGTTTGNPGLCTTCHMKPFDLKDASGAVTYASTGHTFEATPCLDAAGKPLGIEDCADTQRSYLSCTGAGCHGNQDVARAAVASVNARVGRLVAELGALIARVPRSEFSNSDGRISVGEGADFNRMLALSDGEPVHNPFLVEQLLLASIDEVARVYGLTVSPDVSLTPVFLPGN